MLTASARAPRAPASSNRQPPAPDGLADAMADALIEVLEVGDALAAGRLSNYPRAWAAARTRMFVSMGIEEPPMATEPRDLSPESKAERRALIAAQGAWELHLSNCLAYRRADLADLDQVGPALGESWALLLSRLSTLKLPIAG